MPTKMNELIGSFQPIFTSEIRKVTPLNPGHESTNDVFLIKTNTGNYILKALKETYANSSVFWRGLHFLFEADHVTTYHNLKNLSDYLNKLAVIKVPKILEAQVSFQNPIQKPYVLMEYMQGNAVPHESEISQELTKSPEVAYQLGRLLSKIHAQRFTYFGNIAGKGESLTKFPEKFYETIKRLASTRKASQDKMVQGMLPFFLKRAQTMPVPQSTGLIMLDLWPSQFLEKDHAFSALIDFESYVVGPIELELVLLELWLGKHRKFKEAYFEQGLQWPDFEEQRELYRFFLYLLYDCPELGLEACLESKSLFPQGDRIRSRTAAPRPRPGGQINPFEPMH